MVKKSDSDKSSRRQLEVLRSDGVRQRFLRGMVTHDLMQRGLDFDTSYAAAQAIRDRLEDREEVATAEILELIREHLEEIFGKDLSPALLRPVRPVPELSVSHQGAEQPFSRGLLARSIQAAGVDPDRSYQLVAGLQVELVKAEVTSLTREELARRVAELLDRREGVEAARRYRLVRRLHHLPRPLILYIGGASGTGKSTLALELAPLMKIYRVNATDTIRQVMRMVFSPKMLPELYSSSFEVAPFPELAPDESFPGRGDDDFESRLIATFDEQALRVSVGVRAVVERAIAENMSLLVEGVHLCPPLVPFADLEGAAYQVSLVLGTADRESHRARFLTRSREGGRRAERYLENFEAIRVVHDHLMQQAETHETPLIDTSFGEPPVSQTLHLVTSLLQSRLPSMESPGGEGGEAPPVLLVIIDGLADQPVRALGGRTPLDAADTPTLDRLAREGACGLADPIAPGVVADTAAGTLALFGQSPRAMSRGPVEALGAGFWLAPGDVALRANFATLDDRGIILDRRAGRIRDETVKLAAALDRLSLPALSPYDVEVRVKAATEHRLAVVLHGEGLSPAILGSDPGEGSGAVAPLIPSPLEPGDDRAVRTARCLALFEQAARKVLAKHPLNKARRKDNLPQANAVLTRGAGRPHRLVPLEEAGHPLRLTCISGDQTVLGVARRLGAEIVSEEGMTANLDTDLKAKFKAASRSLERSDLVILHLKGADIASHDRRPDLKVDFLERVDQQLEQLVKRDGDKLRIAVGADHATLSESGQHAADPLPVLVWGPGIEADAVERYTEQEVAVGDLQRFPLQMLLGRLFRLS